MNSPKWTEEQHAAINLKGQLLVAAAAGSGKTAVLVERLIRRITNPDDAIDVDRFLVVTFTKAAANEMRERVGKALDDALFTETNPSEVEKLLHQRALLYRANITTLHSFCMELIRQYFYMLDLDPAFRVADEAEADLLRQDTLEDLFETYYEKENSAFLALVDAFGTDRDDQPLMEQVLKLFEFATSQVYPIEWLEQLTKAYEWTSVDDLIQSPWGIAARQGILDKIGESITLLERAYHISIQPDGPLQYAVILQDDLTRFKLLEDTLHNGTWSEVEASFNNATLFPRLPTNKNRANTDEELEKSLREESKKARDEAKKKIDKLKLSLFSFSLQDQIPLLKEMSGIIQTLSAVVQEFSQEYAASKRLRNIVDFSDLEHFALRLLEGEGEGANSSAIALNLQDYFAEVLVDEYQDINPVQERILQLVSRQNGPAPNLFMVGDVKQSIYRFRMADPGLFLKKYNELPHWSFNEKDTIKQNLVIDLNRNFRSRKEVIEGVNFLFRQIMTPGAGEIAYDNQAALQFGASFVNNPTLKTAEGPIEIHLFDSMKININSEILSSSLNNQITPENLSSPNNQDNSSESSMDSGHLGEEDELSNGNSNEPSLEEIEAARIEARLVSGRIKKMIIEKEFRVYDKSLGDFRPVQYSDIVILMRSFSSVAPVFIEEFQSAGIPVYAETTSGYFSANEVETVLSLLKVIDNPRLDIPLAAVLRSPLVGMNGTELGKLRSLLPHGDFYEALVLAFWASLETLNSNGQLPESHWISELEETLNIYHKNLPELLAQAKNILQENTKLQEKVTVFWPKLQNWRKLSRRTSLADLLWHLYEETGYLAYVGTLPAGVQRQANLRVLYDRARRYEATNYRGLFRFLRFLEKFQSQGKDLGNARTFGENEDVVRIITVHSSKGLEFPVVFIVGLGTKFNTRSLTGRLLLHSELGTGIPLIDIENQVRYPSFIQYAVKERLWQESLAEELRILYVALTRAKERLFLYGNVANLDDTLHKWHRLSASCSTEAFPDGQLRSAKNFLDWIGPALARHSNNLFGLEIPPDKVVLNSESQWNVVVHRSIYDDSEVTLLSEPLDDSTIESCPEPITPNPLFSTKIATEISTQNRSESLEIPETWFKEVSTRLSWKYPYSESVTQSAKTSVSELKRRFSWHTDDSIQMHSSLLASTTTTLNESTYSRPKFIQSKKELNPAERGIALHSVMQHLPLNIWRNIWSQVDVQNKAHLITELIESLVQQEILTEEQGKVVLVQDILTFLESSAGTRLLNGKEVRREVPFTLSLKPTYQKDPVLVQGVIDAVILSKEEGKAEVLDFKTDNLKLNSNPEDTLIERYSLQLALYSLAVEQLLKISVQQCTIYSTSLNQEFILPRDIIRARLRQLKHL